MRILSVILLVAILCSCSDASRKFLVPVVIIEHMSEKCDVNEGIDYFEFVEYSGLKEDRYNIYCINGANFELSHGSSKARVLIRDRRDLNRTKRAQKEGEIKNE